jgi:hypothetical protein
LIQVRYCWGGSSFSKRQRQKRQKLFIGVALLLELGPRGVTLFQQRILSLLSAVIHSSARAARRCARAAMTVDTAESSRV